MNPKTKKIIAREGLVIFGLIWFGLVVGFVGRSCSVHSGARILSMIDIKKPIAPEQLSEMIQKDPQLYGQVSDDPQLYDWAKRNPSKYQKLSKVGIRYSTKAMLAYRAENVWQSLLWVYLIYLVARFVNWAIGTLVRDDTKN